MRDLTAVAARLGCPWPLASRLIAELAALHEASRVTVAHAALQLAVACYLAGRWGRVELEAGGCDVVAPAAGLAVEVETGFVPPSAALRPRTYLAARLVAKLARCAREYPLQAVAHPAHVRLPVPRALATPPHLRGPRDVERLHALARTVSPSVDRESVARVNLVAVIRVDLERGSLTVVPLNPAPLRAPNP